MAADLFLLAPAEIRALHYNYRRTWRRNCW